MLNLFLILIGKAIEVFSKTFNLGSGSTWPGHIALNLNKNFIRDILSNSSTKTVLIAGTNGKTTTAKLIETIIKSDGKKVFRNETGANLLNGIASSIVLRSSILSALNYDFGIFEVDENVLPLALQEFTPDYLVILNLFRDQLDRYGETNIIAKKWRESVGKLPKETILVLNADDPQIAELGLSRHSGESRSTGRLQNPDSGQARTRNNSYYFGLNESKTKTLEHAVDSVHCPKCNEKLLYKTITFSHLGNWECPSCNNKRPALTLDRYSFYPLLGTYNKYNTLAAVLLSQINKVNNSTIQQSLHEFKPAFGRQEEIIIDGKKVIIFLSKNPTGFNESLRTIRELKANNILIVLNDRIPDGLDVSWIWDIDIEDLLPETANVVISGDRTYDMGLRIKFANSSNSQLSTLNCQLKENLGQAITLALEQTQKSDVVYILPTYSAMLEVRKIITGKKLL